MTILILGGTSEARTLAAHLVSAHLPVVSSLAGRVSAPVLPAGPVRVGGFGGVDGLVDYLAAAAITGILDATHPFAAQISERAAAAAARTGLPLVRLERPSWREHPEAAHWTWVADADAARDASRGRRPFLTTGRGSLATFVSWTDRDVLFRVVDPPGIALPPRWTVLRARGPYDLAAERQLMVDHGVDTLITKDSGGPLTAAKLNAARELGVPVVVIERPPRTGSVPTVATVSEVLAIVTSSTWPQRTLEQQDLSAER